MIFKTHQYLLATVHCPLFHFNQYKNILIQPIFLKFKPHKYFVVNIMNTILSVYMLVISGQNEGYSCTSQPKLH